MFERETDIIIRKIIDKLPPGQRGTLALKDILAANIPQIIKTFFHRDVESQLLAELQHHHGSSQFAFNHPDVKNLQTEINVILVHNFKFPVQDLHQRLDGVIHMMINYLIRPQWTLTNILFENDTQAGVERITGLLYLFQPYEYLQEIIKHYLHRKNIPSVSKDDFKTLLWKVDGEYIHRRTGLEVASMLEPLYTFFDFPENRGNNLLPIKALIKFFEDKGLILAIPRLEGEIVQGKNDMLQSELSNILDDLYKTNGPFIVEKHETDKPIEEKKISAPDDKHRKPEEENYSDRSPAKFQTDDLFTDTERKRMIRKIFKDDEQYYKNTISALSLCRTWKQASRIIDEVFITFNIDPYGSDSEKFTSAIMRQYYRGT